MGYYMDQMGSQFAIKSENVQAAWDALRALFMQEEKSIHDGSGWHYSWISTKEVLNAKSFAHAMGAARWDISSDGMGGFDEIWFGGEKYGGDEDIILGSIAPFVEPGSYIEMQGEDGNRWKWKFTPDGIEEVYGHWVWDDEE